MDRRTEIRDFLISRRARIKPEQAGLKPAPLAGARRVAGLRREEVALLAGVSVPYYTRLERGDARGATDAVLNAISAALMLDDAERAHLFDLVRAANATAAGARAPRHPARYPVRPELRNMLQAMNGVPAYIRNGRLDLLAGNSLGRALFAPMSRPCAPRSAATRTTRRCPISSASCPPAARPSGSAGHSTTSGGTAPVPSGWTIQSSGS